MVQKSKIIRPGLNIFQINVQAYVVSMRLVWYDLGTLQMKVFLC